MFSKSFALPEKDKVECSNGIGIAADLLNVTHTPREQTFLNLPIGEF